MARGAANAEVERLQAEIMRLRESLDLATDAAASWQRDQYRAWVRLDAVDRALGIPVGGPPLGEAMAHEIRMAKIAALVQASPALSPDERKRVAAAFGLTGPAWGER